MVILNTCPTCGNYNPYAERYPSVATVQRELELIRIEKRHQAIQDKKRHKLELGKNIRRELISRRWSMEEFTQRQLLAGERILRELEQKGRPVGDTRMV